MPIISASTDTVDNFVFKKSAHVFEYFVLYFLTFRAFGYTKSKISIFLSLFFAFLDETHQLFVPGRGGKISDVLVFDSLGIITSYYLTQRFKHVISRIFK